MLDMGPGATHVNERLTREVTMAEKHDDRARYSVANARRSAEAVERARRSNKSWAERRREMRKTVRSADSWKRETRILPRDQARAFAREFLKKYPKAAYWSEVESWRVLDDDVIEFTMRRLPSAD